MSVTAFILEKVVTLDDFRQVEICLNNAAPSVEALQAGIDTDTTSLYYWIHMATDSLRYSVEQIQFLIAEALKYVNPSPLDQQILLKIENVTRAIRNLMDSLSGSRILDPWTSIQADPVQYLRDEEKLTDAVNYCRQIHENSIDLGYYVRDKR
jgi:hypothetical protein